MADHAKGTYQVTGWDEKPYQEQDGSPKLTRARFTNTFSGDFDGEGAAECLMAYPSDSSASFVGHQVFTGSVGDHKGSLVLQYSGAWVGGVAKAQWSVVPGSGTGELAGIKGTGGYVSGENGACDFTLDYEFE